MNYLALRYFLEIGHCLNFSHAARKLHISQPGLSQQITELEKDLGIKLFHRSTRMVTLTEEGRYLYTNLLPSFENVEKTILDLKKAGSIPQNIIRIATVPSAASTQVPFLIHKIKENQPNIQFFIKETTSQESIELIESGQFHLAFIRTPIDTKQKLKDPLRSIELSRHPIQLAVSGDHPAVQFEDIDLYELRDEMFLHYDPKHSPALYYLLELACLTAGFLPKTIATGPEILTVAKLIENKIGITLMPYDMLQLLSTFNIRGVDLKNTSFFSSISVVWNRMNTSILTRDALSIFENTEINI